MTTATRRVLEPMPAERLVFDGLWELTWAGAYWTISIRRKGGKIGYEVAREMKRVGYAASIPEARRLIQVLVGGE